MRSRWYSGIGLCSWGIDSFPVTCFPIITMFYKIPHKNMRSAHLPTFSWALEIDCVGKWGRRLGQHSTRLGKWWLEPAFRLHGSKKGYARRGCRHPQRIYGIVVYNYSFPSAVTSIVTRWTLRILGNFHHQRHLPCTSTQVSQLPDYFMEKQCKVSWPLMSNRRRLRSSRFLTTLRALPKFVSSCRCLQVLIL